MHSTSPCARSTINAVVETFVRFIHDARWREQHAWRRAIWQGMASVGLTGLHALPVNRRWIDIRRRKMGFAHLPPEFEGYRIVHLSDLHFSPVVVKGYLRQLIDFASNLKPDLAVVTGDLITGGHRFVDGVADLLSSLNAPDGVVCTFGNHDYTMMGNRLRVHGTHVADRLERRLEARGLVVLRNERHVVKRQHARLTVVGLDDESTDTLDPDLAFKGVRDDHPVICLNHDPSNARDLLTHPWHWMLSGHTHGRGLCELKVVGRVVRKHRSFVSGHYQLEDRHIYVNRGLSYGQRQHAWCRPEITVFRLASTQH